MPILNDILDHQVLGPVFRQGLEEGRKEEREKMRDQLMRVIEDRFSDLSVPVRARLAELSREEWTAVLRRLPDVSRVEDLFPPQGH